VSFSSAKSCFYVIHIHETVKLTKFLKFIFFLFYFEVGLKPQFSSTKNMNPQKIISVMKQLLLSFAFIFSGGLMLQAQSYSGGAGTTGDPFLIANKADLKYLSEHSSEWTYSFKQTADINFTSADFVSGGDFYNAGFGFSPIGNESIPFKGNYNGNRKQIDGFYINNPNVENVGLFGFTSKSKISDLKLTNVDLNIVNNFLNRLGALIGHAEDSSVVNNCSATGTIYATNYFTEIGGLIGSDYDGTINNCRFSGSVSGKNNVGGLIGQTLNTRIELCKSSGTVTGAVEFSNAGGLIGYNAGFVKKSSSSADVNTIGDSNAGGLIGINASVIQTFTVFSCFATGAVDGSIAGGLIGNSEASSILKMKNCYAIGNVSGTISGGLIGSVSPSDSIMHCYATGLVIGTNAQGGLIAQDYFGGTFDGNVVNCFYDNQTTNQNVSFGATGLPTAQMKIQANFTNWDFLGESTNGTEEVWSMGICNADGSYPILTWQIFENGTGTVADPFLIANKADLKILSTNACLWNKHYKQTSDINFTSADFASGGDFYNAGAGFSPIGIFSTSFSGSYDGNEHIIDSLYINRPTENAIGFFGRTEGGSLISNLGLTHVSFSGNQRVGGVIGQTNQNASISKSFASGEVTGNGTYVGGLVGAHNGHAISCYAKVNCIGLNMYVGGLAGVTANNGSIQSSYAVGTVTGGSSNVGGLTGYVLTATVTNSFWDTLTSGQATSAGGTGKTTTEMQTQSTFTDAGWDFEGETTNGTNDTWKMDGCTNGGYPFFSWQVSSPHPVLSISAQTNVLCSGDSTGAIELSVSDGSAPYTYNWGDGITTEDRTGLAAGTTYVCAVTDAIGCISNISVTITEPTPFVATIGKTDVHCIGEASGAAEVTATGGIVPYTYLWNNNETTAVIDNLTAGTYSVTVTDANGCEVEVDTLINEINAPTTSTTNITTCVTYNWNGVDYAQAGTYTYVTTNSVGCDSTAALVLTFNNPTVVVSQVNPVTLVATGTNVETYQWIDCNSNEVLPNETSETFVATLNGQYFVRVTNSDGCDFDSPCFTINTLGINENEDLNVNISPNPTAGKFTISLEGINEASIKIVDASGKLLHEHKQITSQETLDISHMAVGVYIVQIATKNGIHTERLIKE
jgi:hypothetical protein